MKIQCFIGFLLLQVNSSSAFVSSVSQSRTVTGTSLNVVPVPQEVSAQQLTNYMARSHEEKLKALKTLEDQKNNEIKILKEKIQNAGTSIVQASSSAAPTTVSGSVDELTRKLASYQKFMSEYIVKAQEDKARAVREAEIAIAKKYEAKLQALMLPPSGGSVAASSDDKVSNAFFVKRSQKVAAAAKAGKSRWGDKEVERAAGVNISVPKQTISATPSAFSTPKSGEIPSEVIAADHGLRADGGVGGLTLAERVANGANGVTISNGATPQTIIPNSAYLARNAYITAAAKAGKQSRWGSMEEHKAIEFKSIPLPAAAPDVIIIPEVAAADHGLRADGGVGGPTLAQRVNLGAQLLKQ